MLGALEHRRLVVYVWGFRTPEPPTYNIYIYICVVNIPRPPFLTLSQSYDNEKMQSGLSLSGRGCCSGKGEKPFSFGVLYYTSYREREVALLAQVAR